MQPVGIAAQRFDAVNFVHDLILCLKQLYKQRSMARPVDLVFPVRVAFELFPFATRPFLIEI